MNKEQLLKRLSEMIDEAASTRLYGNIQIDFQAGQPDMIRKLSTQKLREGNPHGRYEKR